MKRQMMSKASISSGCVVLACAMALAVAQAGTLGKPDATVSVRVVDDAGVPVEGAAANIWSLSDMKGHPGVTGRDGIYSCFLRDIQPPIAGLLTKPGFYRSIGDLWECKASGELPTNTLTVVLKRIIEPVPLVRRVNEALFLPRQDVPLALDLEAGDWVEPDGKGKVADVWVTGIRQRAARFDYNLRALLVVSNSLDGFQAFASPDPDKLEIASDLIPPQVAPDAGYRQSMEVFNTMNPEGLGTESWKSGVHNVFRFRSRTNEVGAVISANVGWTKGGIEVGEGRDGRLALSFDYYWNPDPTSRSLEPKEIADRQGK